MGLNVIEHRWWNADLLVELLEKGALHDARGKGDALLLESIAVSLAVDDRRVDALCVLGLLQENNGNSLTASVTVGGFIERLATTVGR